jgi:peptide/nickel transport system substrate-binding protein
MSLGKKMLMLFAAVLFALSFGQMVHAKTFKYSTSGDIMTIDPHSQNEGPNNAMKNNIFECLVLLRQMTVGTYLAIAHK